MITEDLDPWAQTAPWDCIEAGHDHTPRVGDECVITQCRSPLLAGEVAYRVTEVEGYVCWRHVKGGRPA